MRDKVGGACSYCAASFGAKEDVHASDIPLLEEYEGHPSIQKLVAQDYQVILSNPRNLFKEDPSYGQSVSES